MVKEKNRKREDEKLLTRLQKCQEVGTERRIAHFAFLSTSNTPRTVLNFAIYKLCLFCHDCIRRTFSIPIHLSSYYFSISVFLNETLHFREPTLRQLINMVLPNTAFCFKFIEIGFLYKKFDFIVISFLG